MSDMIQTPDGEIYHVSELDDGVECDRCNGFAHVRADLPPTPSEGDYARLDVTDYAGHDNHVVGDLKGNLCPECRADLQEWFEEGGSA